MTDDYKEPINKLPVAHAEKTLVSIKDEYGLTMGMLLLNDSQIKLLNWISNFDIYSYERIDSMVEDLT